MNPEQFLKDITVFNDLILIAKKEGIISEVRGKFSVEQGKEWLTIKNDGCRCHIHLKPDEISHAKFIQNRSKEGREMFSIEILNKNEELILKASFPTQSALEESKTSFEKIKKKYCDLNNGGGIVKFIQQKGIEV